MFPRRAALVGLLSLRQSAWGHQGSWLVVSLAAAGSSLAAAFRENRQAVRFHFWLKPDKACQFAAFRILTSADDAAVYQNQRQAVRPFFHERRLYGWISGKCLRLLRQIESLDRDSLIRKPMEIFREPGENGIDLGPAHSSGAAHRGFIHLKLRHCARLSNSIILELSKRMQYF
jgi:hypothetical protein